MTSSLTRKFLSLRDDKLESLHPEFRGRFRELHQALIWGYETGATETLFKIFETLRIPARQDYLFEKGVTKARAWESAHQFGVAADFVPFANAADAARLDIPVGWHWDPRADWSYLFQMAEVFELCVPISWDLCHVEIPDFEQWRQLKA